MRLRRCWGSTSSSTRWAAPGSSPGTSADLGARDQRRRLAGDLELLVRRDHQHGDRAGVGRDATLTAAGCEVRLVVELDPEEAQAATRRPLAAAARARRYPP